MAATSDMDQLAPVAVVIPAFNSAKTLGRAIESVLGQTWRPRQIVVVDDGSTDGTAELARSYPVELVSHPNRGASAARNRGISATDAPWVAFLDADDEWLPDKLEAQLSASEIAPEVDIICCDFVRVPLRPRETTFLTAEFAGMADVLMDRMSVDAFRTGPRHRGFTSAAMFMFPSGMLVRRRAISAIGGFDEDVRLIEDADFAMRILRDSDVLVVDRPLFRYHMHESNTSRDDLAMTMAFLELLRKMEANPGDYSPAHVESFLRKSPDRVREAIRGLIRRGQTDSARRLLVREGHRLSNGRLTLKLAAWAPPWLVSRALRLRRWVK